MALPVRESGALQEIWEAWEGGAWEMEDEGPRCEPFQGVPQIFGDGKYTQASLRVPVRALAQCQ